MAQPERAWKRHLSGKLIELLAAAEATQVELAKFAHTTQGAVGDHIRMRSFPKLRLLLAYAEFFSNRLGRPVDLYELTGIDQFRCVVPQKRARQTEKRHEEDG